MAQSFRTNLSNVALQYIQQLNVPVTKTTLKENLEQNPYYPSLYSISNTFNRFNIENISFTGTVETLDELQPPFITYCSGQSTGKDFVLVTKIGNETVSYIAENKNPKHLSRKDFLKQWQKVVFVAEANAQSGEKDYKSKVNIENLKQRKRFLLYVGIAALISLLVYPLISTAANTIAAASIVMIKLLGVAATVLLLIYEIDKNNSFVKNICAAGKQTNCAAVLNSKAGKFLGMGWGELGFFYFAASTLFLLLPGQSFTNKLPWLAIAGTLSAPYIVFSIYYQYKVVKQWCPLCLAVQAVLLLELIWALINFWFNNNYSLQSSLLSSPFTPPLEGIGEVCAVAFCILLPIVVWYLIKPILLAAKDALIYNAAYKRLLYNPETFNGLLQQQITAPNGWQQLGINIGNPNATNTIIKVCNPYCSPCAKAHLVLEGIVKKNRDINLKIIFFVSSAEINFVNKPAKHLLAIASKGNLQMTEDALDSWYLSKKKEYEPFAIRFPIECELKSQDEKIDKMKDWCDAADIMGTPTIFINGKKLPQTYNFNELQYVI